ncbi:MAG: hypothetical protein ACYC5X_02225 [Syntrophales bacterium]
MPEYLHQAPGTEVRFIAGHYTIVEEQRIAHCGQEFLAVVGIAAVGSTCCGTQGCRFVNVPGYIVAWKDRLSENGVPVSIVEAVASESEQAEIREILERRFPYSQILFPA